MCLSVFSVLCNPHCLCFKAIMWSHLTAPLISQHATRLHLCLQQVQLFRETKWIMVVFQQHLEVNCMWVQYSFFELIVLA